MPFSITKFGSTLNDLTAYPILTEEIGYPPSPLSSPSGTGAAPSGTAPLGQIATKAVADVLGWKIKSDDPKGFIGALTQSFSLTEVEGHVESKWVQRTYAVQTDLSGGITGAQASIYTRANDALQQSLPLLDGLYALDPEADTEYVTALREVVRSQATELVNELGYSGGPRVSRVNQYFGLLLGLTTSIPPGAFPFNPVNASNLRTTDPDQIQGTLGNLRNVYGISTVVSGNPNPLVNTIEDEQNTTNFRVLADYVTSLAQSWLNNLQFFGLSQSPFFGTQLVLISRQLSVTSELVNELRFALDSVFIGPSERQTLEIQFSTGDPSMFLEDLLGWIERLASDEGPNMIQTGGKFGVYQVVQVLSQLATLVAGAVNPVNSPTIPSAYFTPRVQTALAALGDQLNELIIIANVVATPVLT